MKNILDCGRLALRIFPLAALAAGCLVLAPPVRAVTVTVQPRPGGGTQAKASAVILLGQFNRSLGFLASVTDSGSGYTSFPGVRVVSNAGSGASVSVFSMSGGRVGFVTALPGGSGYSDDATVVIDPPHTGDFQAALDNAAATEIQLEEGLYFQNAEINRDLVIRGRGMGRTVVSGGLLGSVIKILPLASGVRTVRLEDLTLIDGLALNGGGIDNNGARLTLERVEIRGCRAYGPAGEGGAIYNYGGAVLRLIDCHLHHNIASRAGGAISNSGINTSFLPVAAGATDRASAVIQDFFTDFAAVPVPQVAPEIDPATFNPANPPALPDRNAQADSMLGQVEGLVKGVTDTIGDVPALFESLAGETFEASGWGDMKSPTTELVRTRIENNQTGFANGVAKAELTVYEPTYAYRYLGNLNGAYEPLIDSFVTRTVSVPDQRVIGFGGGVHNDLGLLTIKDCDIRDNEVHTLLGSFGGAVSSVLGAVLVKNSRLNENLVRSNTVLASGGAVHGFASYISAEDSELNRNEADVVLFLSSGGAVKNTALGFARFLRCEVDENISGGGGGIANDYLARLEMAGCSISKNSVSGIIGAYGGGVRNENGGLVVLDSCTVAENRASGKAKGAGLYNQCEMTRLGPDEAPIIPIFFSEMVVRNSTLSGNNAFGKGLFDIPLEALGGGIYNGAFNLGIARLSIFSSTIAGNIAEEGIQQRGGGLYATPLSSLKISPSGNVPGLSLVTIANTIFAQNQPSNIASLTGASITSQGFNLSSDGTGPSGFTRNTDPLLAPLGPNGGPTLTHALLPGSPARDAGSPDGAIDPEKAPLTDQRGVTRSLGGRRDIGAFESVPPTLFADSFTALEDFPLTRDPRRGLLANDFGDNLTVTGVTQPAHGTVTFTPRGGFTYTPNANFTGLDSFFYQVVDANGVTGGPMQVSIQVDPVLDLLAVHPSAHSLFTDLDQPITLTFDEPVEVFRVLETVRLEGRLGGRIAFTATTSGNTATLTPTGGFQPGDRVTLRLTTALRGASGSPFLAPVQRRFDVGQRFGSGEFGPGASPDDHPGPRSLLIDLNNDGHLDLVTSSTGNSVWFNDGTGTMVPTGQALTCPRDRNLPVAGIALAAGDLNGDETPDLVLVTDDIRGRNVIWFNDGGGRFSQSRDDLIIDSSRTALGTSNYVPASDVAIGDLNNDGHADILIASHDVQFTGFTHVFLGNGRGGFARSGPSLGFIPGRGAVGVRSARLTDIDGDGDLDAILCLVNFNGGGMQIQLNNGDATFQSNGAVFGNQNSEALETADLNGDGRPDIVVGGTSSLGSHQVWLQSATGTFTLAASVPGGPSEQLAIADINTDGFPDLIVSDRWRATTVHFNNGSGQFTPGRPIPAGPASGLVAGDVEGDGDIDLFVSSAFQRYGIPPGGDREMFYLETSPGRFWLNNRPPSAGAPPSFTVEKNGQLLFNLPSTLLSAASDPDGDPLAVETLATIVHRRPTLGRIWMDFGNVPTTYEGNWPDGEYVYTEIKPVATSHGTLALNADGTFTYTPEPGYLGADAFTYRVTDGISESAPVTVNITVTGDPDEPEARPDWYPNLEFALQLDGNHIIGTSYSITVPAENGVLANDTNRHGLPLTAQRVTGPDNGTLTLHPDGSFVYQSNGAESDEFTYRIVSGGFQSPPVRVALGTRAIIVRDDLYASPGGAPLSRDVETGLLANDTDPNFHLPASETGVFAQIESPPAHGTVTLLPGGAFDYVPNPGYNGPDSFTYSAWAGLGYGFYPTARVKLGNTAPVANNDGGYQVFAGRTLQVGAAQGVLANDTDPDGDPQLTAQLENGPSSGSVQLQPDGSFTYTAAPEFLGNVSFTYRVSDGLELSAPATVTIQVRGIMEVVAVTPSPNTGASANPPVSATFSRNLVAASLAGRIHLSGSLTGRRAFTTSVSGNQLTITPSQSFLPGEQVTVTLAAGIQGSGGTELEIPRAWQFHTAPKRGGAQFTRSVAGTTLNRFAEFVAVGDLNSDGYPDAATWNRDVFPTVYLNSGTGTFTEREEALGAEFPATSGGLAPVIADFNNDGHPELLLRLARSSPFGGTVSDFRIGLNNGSGSFPTTKTLPTSDASGTLLPAALFAGDFNGDGHTDLFAGSGNKAWVLFNDGAGNFTIDSTNALTTNSVRGGAVGDLNGDGLLDVYTVGNVGSQVFLNQGGGRFVKLNQTLDTSLALAVALRDFDGDGALDAAVASTSTTVPNSIWLNDGTGRFRRGAFDLTIASGTVGLVAGDFNANGSADLWQTNTTGSASFLNDGRAKFTRSTALHGTASGLMSAVADFDGDGDLDVFMAVNSTASGTPGNGNELWLNRSVPVARDDFYPPNGGNPVVVIASAGVLANDQTGDGGAMTAAPVDAPARGTVTLNPNGSFTYTPGGTFAGSDVFTYRASDSNGPSNTARVKIGNTAPVAASDGPYIAVNDGPLDVPAASGLLANDTDADGDPLRAVLVTPPANGLLDLRPDGSFRFTPFAGQTGPDSFTYRASDGIAESAVTTVTLGLRERLELIATAPAKNSNSAPKIGSLALTFNRALDPASVASHVVLARRQSKPAAFTTSVAGPVLTLTPATGFFAGETLTIVLKPGLQGSGGESLSAPIQYDFTIEGPAGSGSFANSNQALGDTTYSSNGIALGDLNGDGFPDFVIPNGQTDFTPGAPFIGARVWFGNASGTFSDSGQALGTVSNSRAALADLDSDGDLDLVLRVSTGGGRIFFNNGSGVFTESPQTLTTELLFEIVPVDVNGDGHTDLVGYEARVFFVWLNNGSGTFSLKPDAADRLNLTNRSVTAVRFADLDGDGDPDAVARQFTSDRPMLVWRNDGRGAFEDAGTFGQGETGLALADLNGDGTVDVFAPTQNGNFVWLNDGKASFTPTGQTYGNFRVIDARLADVNGDGFPDAVVVQRTDPGNFVDPIFNRTTVYLNNGQGQFTGSGEILGDFGQAGGSDVIPSTITTGDANRDGAIDVFLTGGFRRASQLWLNTPTLPTPVGTRQLAILDTETARPFESVSLRVAPTDLVSLAVSFDNPAKGTFLTVSLAAAGFTGPVGGVFTRPVSTAAAAEAALRQLVFGPAANRRPVGQSETTTFTLTVTRGPQQRVDSSTSLTATSVNDAPSAQADSGTGFITDESTAFTTANVLGNDTDPDPGDNFSVVGIETTGTLGAVTSNGNGTFHYDPRGAFNNLANGQSATDSFTYLLADPHGARSSARVTITINGRNSPPVAVPDAITIQENSGINIITALLLGNDTDLDTDDFAQLRISAINPTGILGSLQLAADGSLAYDPAGSGPNLAPGATRSTAFHYTVRDPAGATSTARVDVTIVGVNDAPLVSPAALTIAENAPATTITASLLANASDPDPGQTASLVVSSVIPGPTTSGGLTLHGTVVRYLTDGRFDSLQEGQTAEDVFDFEVRDPLGAVALAKATVIITGVNTAPVALAATPLLALPDASIDLTAVLAASVIDPDDAPDDIRIHAIDPTGVQGTLVLDNGRLSYTPPAGLVVPDGRYFEETFRYRARDLRGATSDEATATLVFYRVIPQAAALPKLVVEAVPGTPIPFLDTFDFGGALLTEQKSQTFIVRNDGDAPLDIIAVQTVYGNEADFPIEEFTMPALLAPGESRQVVIHFAPKALGNRQSEFWITSNDPDHEHFKILLTGTGNRAPLFYGYEAATAYETPASILRAKILQAGWDPDGHALTVGAVAPATREGGSAEIIGNYVRYTPPAGFWGEDIITVTIRDAFGATASGPLTVTVRPPANAGGPNVVAPSLTPVPGGGMRIRARAIPGFTYEIQRSTNLTDWETIATVPAGPTGGLEHTDPNPPQPSGFYRIHGR